MSAPIQRQRIAPVADHGLGQHDVRAVVEVDVVGLQRAEDPVDLRILARNPSASP